MQITKKQKAAWDEVRLALSHAKASGLGWANCYGILVPFNKSVIEGIYPDENGYSHENIIMQDDVSDFYQNEIKLNCGELSDDPHYIILKTGTKK